MRKDAYGMEKVIGILLTAGVGLSAAFLTAGLVWRWFNTGSPQLDYVISGSNLFQFWVSDLRQAASGAFRPRLLINLGIALLLITPYLRVAASTLYFAFIERNTKYALFTAFVLAVLTYSLFLQ